MIDMLFLIIDYIRTVIIKNIKNITKNNIENDLE